MYVPCEQWPILYRTRQRAGFAVSALLADKAKAQGHWVTERSGETKAGVVAV